MQKTQEDGTQKKVSEQYVVEAATFGEAERRNHRMPEALYRG